MVLPPSLFDWRCWAQGCPSSWWLPSWPKGRGGQSADADEEGIRPLSGAPKKIKTHWDFWAKLWAIGQIFIVANCKYYKHNQAISSNCSQPYLNWPFPVFFFCFDCLLKLKRPMFDEFVNMTMVVIGMELHIVLLFQNFSKVLLLFSV